MAEVLLYNIEKSKAVKIKVLCHKMGIATRTVPREDFGVKLSALLGLTEDREAKPDSEFDAEMLYFSDVIPPILSLNLPGRLWIKSFHMPGSSLRSYALGASSV